MYSQVSSDRSSSNSSPVSFEGTPETLANQSSTNTENMSNAEKLDMDLAGNREVQLPAAKVVEDPEEGVTVPCTSGSGMATGIDTLLQRHRNEIMFELRRLQMGDRPVTGQGNKEAVETFFSRALNTDTTQEPREQHRPESVIVEVNALVERQPVRALLQSSLFRRNLESALRGAIRNLPPSTPTSSAQGGARPRTRATAQPNVNSERSETVENAHARIPPPPPMPNNPTEPIASQPIQLQATQQQPPRPQQQPVQQQAPIPQQPRPQYAPHQQPRPQYAPHQHPRAHQQHARAQQPQQRAPPVQPAVSWAQQWLHEELPAEVDPSDMQQRTIGDLMEDARQEEFIADISELVQRQLVTSSLESNFRNSLERLMRNQLENTGTDGQRVQQFLRTLPRTDMPRNDFSHLGITGPQQGSLSDDISIISATAAVTIPYAQSNTAMSREMAALKSQVAELKNMMRLSFDLQLDTQRAIRQEVAAAISCAISDVAHAGGASSGAAPATSAPPRSHAASESHCLICLDRSVDTVLYQCGHMCVCHSCGLNLRTRGAHCPVCRAPIRDIIRAYRCNPDE